MDKKIIITVLAFMLLGGNIVSAQNSLRDEFIKESKRKYEAYKKEQQEAYDRFTKEQNEEYAKFMEEKWELYENFMKETSPYTEPKFNEAPVAPNTDKFSFSGAIDAVSDFVVRVFSKIKEKVEDKKDDKEDASLPLKNIDNVEEKDTLPLIAKEEEEEKDTLPLIAKEEKEGKDTLPLIAKEEEEEKDTLPLIAEEEVEENTVILSQNDEVAEVAIDEPKQDPYSIEIDFYGQKLQFHVHDSLKVKANGTTERDAANYFRAISKYPEESSALWKEISDVSKKYGLNEWGEYLVLQKISEALFQNTRDRVLFCHYMLRNEGLYKVKVARGSVSNDLVLLMALDNTKDIFSYGFFIFSEQDNKVKYYSVYGAGKEEKSICTYRYASQDTQLKQVRLDFDSVLSIGECDRIRELKINKLNKTMELPFNSHNVAFLNDVPMTGFPIYFVSAMSLESQDVLKSSFGDLKEKYSTVDAVEILLNFVQYSFNYKTDGDQFGYEKYFYPEEALGYPYCDCEDRSALFGWLVRTYLELPVIGLQYPGHLATAVALGDDVNISGESFMYGGKKYYVCDPTYIGAGVGLGMPNFKNVLPKVVKLKKI